MNERERNKMATRQLDNLLLSHEQEQTYISRRKLRLTEIENNIIKHVGVKTEGATTLKTQRYKVTTTGKINREVEQNTDRLLALAAEIGINLYVNVIDREFTLNEEIFKELKHFEPDKYAAIAELVTEKPAKPSLKIERLNQERK
jgi:hypothetical protein